MSEETKPISAKTMRMAYTMKAATGDRIESFNQKCKRALEEQHEVLHLEFTEFGYDWPDIQWVIDLGYKVSRNRACLWWEVKWNGE